MVYSIFTIPWPYICDLWIVTYINKYKLNLYFLTKRKRASRWVSWGFFIFEVIIVTNPILLTSVACSKIKNKNYQIGSVSCGFFLLCTAIASLYFHCKLTKIMNFGIMVHQKKKLRYAEVLVQIICLV